MNIFNSRRNIDEKAAAKEPLKEPFIPESLYGVREYEARKNIKPQTQFEIILDKLNSMEIKITNVQVRLDSLDALLKESSRKDKEMLSLKDDLRGMSNYIQELLKSLLHKVANGIEHNMEQPKVIQKSSFAVEDYIAKKNAEAVKPKLP